MSGIWHLLQSLPEDMLLQHWETCRAVADRGEPVNEIDSEMPGATAWFRGWDPVRGPVDGGHAWLLVRDQANRPLLVYRDGRECYATRMDLVTEEVGS